MFARPRRHIAIHVLLEVEGVYDDGFGYFAALSSPSLITSAIRLPSGDHA